MGQRRYFTIQRGRGIELTVVGVSGQTHVMPGNEHGADGHFTDEGAYRRAIETAVRANRQ